MKKGDAILICVCALVCGILFLIPRTGNSFTVYSSGRISGSYSLNTDRTVEVNGVTICVENGKVFVSDSSCKDKVCVKSGKINKGSIACLPQKVVIVINSAHLPDGVTG